MNYFTDLPAARRALELDGGWLLDEGTTYLVTYDKGTVLDLRGQSFLDWCEEHEVWDETMMPAGVPARI